MEKLNIKHTWQNKEPNEHVCVFEGEQVGETVHVMQSSWT